MLKVYHVSELIYLGSVLIMEKFDNYTICNIYKYELENKYTIVAAHMNVEALVKCFIIMDELRKQKEVMRTKFS